MSRFTADDLARCVEEACREWEGSGGTRLPHRVLVDRFITYLCTNVNRRSRELEELPREETSGLVQEEAATSVSEFLAEPVYQQFASASPVPPPSGWKTGYWPDFTITGTLKADPPHQE